MTPRNCPHCRRWVPRFAPRCPGCGELPIRIAGNLRKGPGLPFINWVRAWLDLAPIAPPTAERRGAGGDCA